MSWTNDRKSSSSDLLRSLLNPVVHTIANRHTFRFFQRIGLHVLPVHFYSPVPDSQELDLNGWSDPKFEHGIDYNPNCQRQWLEWIGEALGEEIGSLLSGRDQIGHFQPENGAFAGVDAAMLYAMIRRYAPKRIVEIGSGHSTCCMLDAIEAHRRNGDSGYDPDFRVCDPYPLDSSVVPRDLVQIEEISAQKLCPEHFEHLSEGDILFIDSTHVVKPGSDLVNIMLRIIPSIPPGVLVHFHDIFLPRDYPETWIFRNRMFWNEQYFLHVFLQHNSAYEVVWAGQYCHLMMKENLKKTFSFYDPDTDSPGSFWIRKLPHG